MIDISNSERNFILALLAFGLFFTGLSYYRNTSSSPQPRTIAINENHSLININTAMEEQFERLPGIGPVLARNIVLYRQTIGGFKSIEELKNIKGIGDKKVEHIEHLIISE